MNDKAQVYKDSFEAFLSKTDEKRVLRGELQRMIQGRNIHSILDIGAGNGDLSKPLTTCVSRYVAVEKNPVFSKMLSDAGIRVHESMWPAQLPLERDSVQSHFYDMVLLSHVISYESDDWKNILREAWWHVRPGGGVMTLVTYRGDENEWTRVMQELGQGGYYSVDTHREKFHEITHILKRLGKVSNMQVVSHVTVLKHLDEMLQALEFVYTNGRADRIPDWMKIRAKFRRILRERYDVNLPYSARKVLKPKYQFPFPHYFMTVEKDTDVFISYKCRGENRDFVCGMIGAVEEALHSQDRTTFCNLTADTYYERNNFTDAQIFEHVFSELEHSKKHLIVVHSNERSDGIVQELDQSFEQEKRVIIAKKKGIRADYVSEVVPAGEIIHWSTFEDLAEQVRNHTGFRRVA